MAAGCAKVIGVNGETASVAALAATPGWTVTAGGKGRWTTAERPLTTPSGQHWTVGLTPTAAGRIALMLWSGDEIVAHHRGTESEMCVLATRWVANLLAGRPWAGHAG